MADPYTTRDIDAHRPASPRRSSLYISVDTEEVWIAFTAGVWTKIYPPAAVGSEAEANKVLRFNAFF